MTQVRQAPRFFTQRALTATEKHTLQVFREEVQRAQAEEGESDSVYPAYMGVAFQRTRSRLQVERGEPKKPKSLKEAIRAVSNELMAMNPEEFRALLDAHRLGDVGQALLELHEAAHAEAPPVGGFYGLDESSGVEAAGQEGQRAGGLPAGGRGAQS